MVFPLVLLSDDCWAGPLVGRKVPQRAGLTVPQRDVLMAVQKVRLKAAQRALLSADH